MQVIRRSTIPVDPVRPLLLEGQAEQCHTSGLVTHHGQKVANIRAFLNIIGQVEMGVVEIIVASLRAPRCSTDKQKSKEPRDKQPALLAS